MELSTAAPHLGALCVCYAERYATQAGWAAGWPELFSPVSTELSSMLCRLELVRPNFLEKSLPDENLEVATASSVVFRAADDHVVVVSPVARIGKENGAAALDDPLEQGLLRCVQHPSKVTATAACNVALRRIQLQLLVCSATGAPKG